MDKTLRYVLRTLAKDKDSTFMDIYRVLTDPAFRERMKQKVAEPDLVDFWEHFKTTEQGVQPIIARLARLVDTSVAASLDSSSGIDVGEIMDNRKILIVRIPKGASRQDSAILGTLLISQIQNAALRRARIPKKDRAPFYLYVDEFQNFISSPFDEIISESGKFRLHLIFAHQYLGQITDSQTRAAIFGNSPITICFRVGVDDANYLAKYFYPAEPEDLMRLRKFSIAVSVPPHDAIVIRKTAPPQRTSASYAEEIKRRTRDTYQPFVKTKRYEPPAVQDDEPVPPTRPKKKPSRPPYRGPKKSKRKPG